MNLIALRSPPFRSYILSLHLALNGFWAQRVIMGWLAWVLTGSPSFVGLVAFLNFVPTLIVSPLFGVVADRIDVRVGSMVSYTFAGTLSGIFAWICLADALTPFLLAGFSLLSGVISSANHPMRMSLTPRLAPKEHLASVVALTSLNFNLSRLMGPAIGGVLIQAIGAADALVLTAIAYIPPVIAIFFMRPRARSQSAEPTARQGYFFELFGGWRYALTRHLVRTAIIFSGLGALAGRSVLETLPILANGVFGKGPAGLGMMTAAAGAGAAIAAILKAVSKAQSAGRFQTSMLAMVMIVPLLVASLSQISAFPVATGIVILLGGTLTMLSISLQSLVQMEIDDHYRGRVMGLWTTVSIGSGALGAVIMGAMTDLLGVPLAQASIGFTLAAISAMMIFRFRRTSR